MTQSTSAAEALAVRQGVAFPRQRLRWLRTFVRTQPLGTLGFLLILLMVIGAVFAPLLRTSDPAAFGSEVLKAPSWAHWMGTNREGRDVWSRVLYGGRVSLEIGIAVVFISVIGGTIIALVAGYLGGIADFLISRVIDVLIAFPSILFALTLRTSFEGDFDKQLLLVVSICIIFTPVITRIMRGAVLEQRGAMYVEAARVLGASEWRIMFRHLLPNLAGLMIVVTSTTLPAAILTESALSFLGVGLDISTPSWGGDLSGPARTFFTSAWWIAVFPGLALSVTVLAFNLLGDSLRDTLDPRLRGKR